MGASVLQGPPDLPGYGNTVVSLLLPGRALSVASSCGDDPGAVCDWVYDRTGNGKLAASADWFVGTPFSIVVIVVVAWLLTRLARRLIRRGMTQVRRFDLVRDPRANARASSIADVVTSSVNVAILAITVIVVIGELGIDLAPLIAGAGIAGVALGFGAQSLVRDCLTGLFMIIEDQFGIGDVVDLGEASGVVERVSLRVTVLRSVDGTVWHVPNGEVKRVGNRSQLWSVAVVDVDVPQDADLDTVKPAVLEAATAVATDPEHAETVLEAPQLLGIEAITPDAITLRLLVKTVPSGQWALQRALREAVKRRLTELGVSAPIPGQALWSRLAGRPPVKPGATSDRQESDS